MSKTSLALDHLESKLREVYGTLYRQYRRGTFADVLTAYEVEWKELGGRKFYVYSTDVPEAEPLAVGYREAVKNLYDLLVSLDQERPDWVDAHAIEILQMKNLVYEICDQFLDVPVELGVYMFQEAQRFVDRVRSGTAKEHASQACLENTVAREYTYDRPRVLKIQIVAALCGINNLYRAHEPEKYALALEFINVIETFVRRDLPLEYSPRRDCFGLLGMTTFLHGRVLSAQGDYDGAQSAFAQSSDAYVARLDQKGKFFEEKFIDAEAFEEKKRVTLRRAALLSALGVGYVSFINGHISQALIALRSSRLDLKHNVGAVHGAFVDILFFACRRAVGSSDRQIMEDVVTGLRACRKTLKPLVQDSHYYHRAGLELATALHCRAKLLAAAGEDAAKDQTEALNCLNQAILYSEKLKEQRPQNSRLLVESLIIRSYVKRWMPLGLGEDHHARLTSAMDDAIRANRVAKGRSWTKCEALIGLGVAHYHEYKNSPVDSRDINDLREAQTYFREALTVNGGRNPRIEGVCYLNLARLGLYDPATIALAHDYFQRWTRIKDRVEHIYCRELADRVSERLSANGPLLIINAEASLSYPDWEKKLREHLLNTMLRNLAQETAGEQLDEARSRTLIVEKLINDLNFRRSKAYELVKDEKFDLLRKLERLRH
jgi:hypothetical protein